MHLSLKSLGPAILTTLVLSACGAEKSADPELAGSGVDTRRIADQLLASSVDAIVLNDGQQPMTGEWPRFAPDATWNWQLNSEAGASDPTAINLEYEADVYVVDMFAQLSTDSVVSLKDMGREVICYFSAGTYEPWRPDKDLFRQDMLGNPHQGYPNERWLDIQHPRVAKLMVNRMDMAVALGCDGVELDNVDGWIPSVNSGFDFTLEDQLQFNKILANEAHERGLAVALKNNVEMIVELSDYFDLVINEECFEYNECEGYRPMIEKGKPVFNAEYKLFGPGGEVLLPVSDYPNERNELCAVSSQLGFQTLFLPIELDGSFRLSCR